MRFELKEQMKQLSKGLPGFTQYALQLRNIMSPDDLQEDMLTAIADRAFIGEDELPRSNQEFMNLKQRARTRLPAVTDAAVRLVQGVAAEYQPLIVNLNSLPQPMARMKREIEEQLGRLLGKHFVSRTPWERLQHLPRYLKAMRLRLEKYPSAVERDTRHAQAVNLLWERYAQRLEAQKKAGRVSPDLLEFRWLIEELRVSLFAQELKTPFPVSTKRLEKIWLDIKD
jgi:ATP-dependent helicase HrpA